MNVGLKNISGSHIITGQIIYKHMERQNKKTQHHPAVLLHTVDEAQPLNGRFITKPPSSLPRCGVSRSPFNFGNFSGTTVRQVCIFLLTM